MYSTAWKLIENNPSEITIPNVSKLVVGHLKGDCDKKHIKHHIRKIKTMQKMIENKHHHVALKNKYQLDQSMTRRYKESVPIIIDDNIYTQNCV